MKNLSERKKIEKNQLIGFTADYLFLTSFEIKGLQVAKVP